MNKKYLGIDMKPLRNLLSAMESELGEAQFRKMMIRAFRRVPGHVRKVLPGELKKDYYVNPSHVRKSIGGAKVETTNRFSHTGVTCIIPIREARNVIGGDQFKVTAGTRRRKPMLTRKGKRVPNKRYHIDAKILKSRISVLPKKMPGEGRSSYGDQPPFVTAKGGKTHGVVMTRKYADRRLPIIRVTGIGIPQMPLNQSRKAVEEDILNFTMGRIEHEYRVIMERLQKKAEQ